MQTLALGQLLTSLLDQLGLGLDDAERYALGISAHPGHRLAQVSAVARSKPNPSATTAAQSVSTGARLMRSVSPFAAMQPHEVRTRTLIARSQAVKLPFPRPRTRSHRGEIAPSARAESPWADPS